MNYPHFSKNLTDSSILFRRVKKTLMVGLLLTSAEGFARATAYTYTPTNATTDTWTAGTNWNATPVSGTANALTFVGTNTTVLASGLTNINTDNISGAFALNSLSLQGTGPATGSASITINSTSPSTGLSFGGTSPTVNLNALVGAGGGLTYNVNQAIALAANTTFTGNGTATFNFGGAISGTGFGITKSGTSVLTLSGNNTYTGATTVSAGTLILSGSNTSATGATTVANGATLRLLTNANAIAGSALTLSSGSTLQLRADSNTTFTPASIAATTGTININVDKVSTGSGNTLTLGGAITESGNTTFVVTGGSSDILGLGQITLNGNSGPGLTLNNSVGLTIAGFTGSAGGDSGIVFAGSGNTTVTGASAGNATNRNFRITQSGTGTTTLSGTIAFNGTGTNTSTLTLQAGKLVLNNTGALGGLGTFTISGGTLDAGVAITTAASNPTQTWNGSFTFTGSNNLNLGTGAVTVSGNNTVTVGANTLTVGATNINNNGLTKAGNGNLTLGGVALTTGLSQIGDSSTTGTFTLGAVTRSTGATADFSGAGLSNIAFSGTQAVASGATTGNVLVSAAANGVAYATANGGATWATVPSAGTVGALATYSNTYTALNNVDVANGDSVSGVTVNTLRFNAVSDALTLAGTNTVNTGGVLITPTSTTASISGGTIRSGGGKELVVFNNGSALTISSVVANSASGASAFTISGLGNTTLSGANTYSGATSINGGSVTLGVGQNGTTSGAFGTGAGALTLGSNTTLDLAGNNVSVAGLSVSAGAGTGSTIGSSTTATLTANGTTNLSGLTVTGNTTIYDNGGALTLPATAVFSGSGGTLKLAGGVGRQNNVGGALGNATLYLNGVTNFQNTSVQLITGNLIIDGTNAWNYQANVTVNGSLTGAGTLNGNIGFTNRSFTLNGDATAFTGTLDFNANNGDGTFLILANSTAVGAGLAAVNLTGTGPTNRAYLQYTGGGNKTVAVGSLSGTTNTFVQNATASTTSTWQIGARFTDTVFSGVIATNGTALSALEKVGTGSLTLAGVNTYTGSTTVTAGTLQIGNGTSGSIDTSSSVTVGSSGTLAFNEANGSTFSTAITSSGLVVGVEDSGVTNTLSGGISGGAFTQSGLGKTIFSAVNAYTGATSINQGTLQLAVNGAINSGSSIIVGNGITTGTLALGTFNDTVAGVQLLGGSITGSGGVLTSLSDFDLQSGTVSAILDGAVGANIDGASSTVTLSGANTYTGTTTVSNGNIVNYQNGTAFGGNSAIFVATGATAQVQGNITGGSQNLTLRGSGASGLGATGALENVSGNNSYAGAIILGNSSTISSDAGSLTLSGGVTGSGNLTLQSQSSGNGTIAFTTGSVNPTGTIINSGSGTGGTSISSIIGTNVTGVTQNSSTSSLTLGGANTYTGPTTITSGTLQLGNALAVQNSTVAVNTANGLAFGTGIGTFTAGGLSGSGGTSLTDTGATAVTLKVGKNNASTTYSGALSGSGALTKIGTGTLTLSGANSFTGVTTISAGTLALSAASNNVANSSKLLVGDVAGSGAVLDVSGVTGGFHVVSGQTLAGHGSITGAVTQDAGSILSPGNSAGTLTVNSNLTLNNNAAGSLVFDLGTNTAASDQVVVSGLLTLNNQDFGSFTFNNLGVTAGTYVLFDGTSLSGSLGGITTSTQFAGFNATLVLDNVNHDLDLVLTTAVVPEPGTWAMLLGGMAALVLIQRRRSKQL